MTHALLLCFTWPLLFVPQSPLLQSSGDNPASLSVLRMNALDKQVDGTTLQQIQILEETLRSSPEHDESAKKLMALAEELYNSKRPASPESREASRIGRNLFLSSAPNKVRAKAYWMYRQAYPFEIKRHVKELTLITPGVTCFGRFKDSFNKHVVKPHPGIWSVTVSNSYRQDLTSANRDPEDFVLGSDAIVVFTVDKSFSAADLKQALASSKAYRLDNWQILIPTPLMQLEE